jgi:Na+-transporting methylmalonyl-CoA/oxaloacetate decarboxylase gamma subunit
MILAIAYSQGVVMGGVLVGIVVLMAGIHFLGRFLAATHPEPPKAVVPVVQNSVPPEMLTAVIAAAVHAMVKQPARIVSISPVRPPSVERLMQQWSLEGRRAIYSSHNFR